jgi:hypothetical protein
MRSTRTPFGQADCESEVKLLKSDYSRLYFDETPFNEAAIDPATYLIIGRRGAGKTALTQYFSFQRVIHEPIYIDIDEPAVYQQVLSDIATRAAETREIAIPRLKKVWDYVIWCVIFEHARDQSSVIAAACDANCSRSRVSQFIGAILDRLAAVFRDVDDRHIDANIDRLLDDRQVLAARDAVRSLAVRRPLILAIDTLEKYDVNDDALMNAMAALVQSAAEFNLEWSPRGVHIKAFMSGEVFPYLRETVLQNPLKHVKDPVYLLWRPRDLLRLICWRFHRCLAQQQMLRHESTEPLDWESPSDVMAKMWKPYFGASITNGLGLREHSFAYVLRHTQMRPRQLILLCNSIADKAIRRKTYPVMTEADVRDGIAECETALASEIINAFSSVYPRVSTIVDALMRMPMSFPGRELDKRASQSASEWPQGTYSSAAFRRLVAELGIVGRVRRHNETAGYIDADFEYSMVDRLPLTHRDECVIHPMFYSRLNVDLSMPARVMPFTTGREDLE